MLRTGIALHTARAMYANPARDIMEPWPPIRIFQATPKPTAVMDGIVKSLEPWTYLLSLTAFCCGFLLIVYYQPVLFGEADPKKKLPPSQSQPSSRGLKAGFKDGFCGSNEIHLSRVPHNFEIPPDWRLFHRPNWLALLGVIHSRPVSLPADIQLQLRSAWPEDLVNFVTS